MSEKIEKLLQEELGKLQEMRNLLILIASRLGSNSIDIGKAMGVDSSRVRQIMSGVTKKGGVKSQQDG